jgi:hypothetical protein
MSELEDKYSRFFREHNIDIETIEINAASASATPANLTDGATITTDASLGNHFRVTLTGNRTLANPTNARDGQRILFEITQDGVGSRTLTLGNKFVLGSDITEVTLSTGSGKKDFIGVQYNETTDKFYVLAVARGY